MSLPDHPFWAFSLDVYARSGVADSCIALQDKVGADVNVLLFCCWLGRAAARELTEAELQSIRAAVSAWQAEVVAPVRGVRRRLKSGFEHVEKESSDGLRRSIQNLEIECERLEQLSLAALIPLAEASEVTAAERVRAALANLSRYFASLNRDWPGEDVKVLLSACFPDIDEQHLKRTIAGTHGP